MKKPFVAIVDDDSGFAAYLRTFLSLRGYEARCYTRGDEMLASTKQSEAPDVVLLDVMMPGLDGLATLRAIKASRPQAQVIMLSGRNQASTIVEAVRLGAADYVVKPDDPEGLGEIALDVAIKNAIEKNRLVSELSELRQQLRDDAHRQVRTGGRRHADARRDRRDEAGAAGQAPARAAGRRVHQAWQQQAHPGGRSHRRRCQPRSREYAGQRLLPRRS